MKFKVGDKVKCVDSRGSSGMKAGLVLGEAYKVEKIWGAFDRLEVCGVNGVFRPSRFVRISRYTNTPRSEI